MPWLRDGEVGCAFTVLVSWRVAVMVFLLWVLLCFLLYYGGIKATLQASQGRDDSKPTK